MSRLSTSFILGYHGCDKSVGTKALSGKTSLLQSDKDYDWLGPGIYFWEGDPLRAKEWAVEKVKRGQYKDAFVVGAVIDLGNCLDLVARENLELLKFGYESLAASHLKSGQALPKNSDLKADGAKDKLLRFLDCAVIRRVHAIVEQPVSAADSGALPAPFDTVRGLFSEGEPVYPGGGFHLKTHTQVAVRNLDCIKGVFRVA